MDVAPDPQAPPATNDTDGAPKAPPLDIGTWVNLRVNGQWERMQLSWIGPHNTLFLFTGAHTDYHRPSDTAEKINYEGLVRLADLVTDVIRELATAPGRPAYIEVASPQFARGGDRPYFGSIPDFGKPGGGYAISGVAKDSPAARGGLAGGDLIVRLGESAITNLEDFDSALRKYKAGETVPVVVLREGKEVRLAVKLDPPR